jgi:hypothetical protein
MVFSPVGARWLTGRVGLVADFDPYAAARANEKLHNEMLVEKTF